MMLIPEPPFVAAAALLSAVQDIQHSNRRAKKSRHVGLS